MANGNQAIPAGVYFVGAPRAAVSTDTLRDEITLGGWALFAIGLGVAGSAFDSLRFEFMNLLVHPILLLIMVIAPFVVLTRLQDFPAKALAGLIVFTAMYSFSNLGTPLFTGETIKLTAISLTILTTALLVRTPADFRLGVLGLMISTVIISVLTLQGNALDSHRGAIESGHKNTFSLYVLPALLLGGYLVLQKKNVSTLLKIALLAGMFLTLAATFTSGNRSGWVCAILIGVMLLASGRSFSALFLVVLLAAGTYYGLTRFGSTEATEWAWEKTGNESDTTRIQLFLVGMQIGLEHPLLGVSPDQLPFELGRHYVIGFTHNVVAHLAGASGFVCLAGLLFVGWTLWRWPPHDTLSEEAKQRFYAARRLPRMMLFLWLARGMFTHEILYSHAFAIGLGLSIGYVAIMQMPGAMRRMGVAG